MLNTRRCCCTAFYLSDKTCDSNPLSPPSYPTAHTTQWGWGEWSLEATFDVGHS
jgi:hypothetical protein